MGSKGLVGMHGSSRGGGGGRGSGPHRRGPLGGFGEQGKKGVYFRGTGEQRPNFEGNRETKTILGNREHKKTNFRFWGNRGISQFISGEQGNSNPSTPPPPLGGPHRKIIRYMGRSRSKPPPAPDEISWFRAWGVAIYFTGMH